MKRLISVFAVVFLLFSFASLLPVNAETQEIWDGKRASKFAGGSGTKEDPWQISNGKELAYMQYIFCTTVLKDWLPYEETYGGDYFVLTKDIYLNDVSNFDSWGLKDKAPPNKWTRSIGYGGYALTSGTLDGQGHTIYGMYQVNADINGGLITVYGDTSSGKHATVKNLRMEKCMAYLSTRSGLLGNVDGGGVVSNCYVSGKVIGYNKDGTGIGGIAGVLTTGTIEDCVFVGSVEGVGLNTGGIVGKTGHGNENEMYNGVIRNCINYGTVTSTGKGTGGICGTMGMQYHSATIDNCLNLGTVSGAEMVGGITGSADHIVTAADDADPGAVKNRPYVLTIQNSLNCAKISGSASVGSIVGIGTDHSKIDNCYYDSTVCSAPGIAEDPKGSLAVNIKKLDSAAMRGQGAVSKMKLDSKVWQDIDGYYPVIKTLHSNGWTIIAKGNDSTDSKLPTSTTVGIQKPTASNTTGSVHLTTEGAVSTSGTTYGTIPENNSDTTQAVSALVSTSAAKQTSATEPQTENHGKSNGTTLWIVFGAVIVVGVAVGCLYWLVIRKKLRSEGKL